MRAARAPPVRRGPHRAGSIAGFGAGSSQWARHVPDAASSVRSGVPDDYRAIQGGRATRAIAASASGGCGAYAARFRSADDRAAEGSGELAGRGVFEEEGGDGSVGKRGDMTRTVPTFLSAQLSVARGKRYW